MNNKTKILVNIVAFITTRRFHFEFSVCLFYLEHYEWPEMRSNRSKIYLIEWIDSSAAELNASAHTHILHDRYNDIMVQKFFISILSLFSKKFEWKLYTFIAYIHLWRLHGENSVVTMSKKYICAWLYAKQWIICTQLGFMCKIVWLVKYHLKSFSLLFHHSIIRFDGSFSAVLCDACIWWWISYSGHCAMNCDCFSVMYAYLKSSNSLRMDHQPVIYLYMQS